MNFKLNSNNLTLSAEQKDYIQKKITKILHYSERAEDESTSVSVSVNHEGTQSKDNRIYCAINIAVPQQNLYAECYAATVEGSVDECEEKLRRQVKKYKTKLLQH